MFTIVKKQIEWGSRLLTIETGHMARQARGAVKIQYGDTVLLCTVSCGAKLEDVDFLPMTVNYQDKFYAAGRLPGGFNKREGRPSESEILTSRLIDRPIRPLFKKGFHYDTQLIITSLSLDNENKPDIVALIGISAALHIANLPFDGPIGAARVGYINNAFVLNPTKNQLEKSDLDLVVAGTKEGILMVESEASELSETTMLEAVNWGFQSFQPVIEMIESFAQEVHNTVEPLLPNDLTENESIKEALKESTYESLQEAYTITDKQERYHTLDAIREKALNKYIKNNPEALPDKMKLLFNAFFKEFEAEIVRGNILQHSQRIDDRALDEIRPIESLVNVIPRVHGSALFTRGSTQALVITTLGTQQDEQLVDTPTGEYREPFLLYYNFPPFSVGETGRLGIPSRREIGHGKLAWRAIKAVLPTKDTFNYTLRIVSEILESNGSSSMATVCGTSLSLMDAGVPLKNTCAGIAMGLIKEGEQYAVLTDILGDEDHLGDMDFKVAGTKEGITALQMDIKITSITSEIMENALEAARIARLKIIDNMENCINEPRNKISDLAPKIESLQISKDKIRDVIGVGGKIIREITENTNTKIEIEDSGKINISSSNSTDIEKAKKWIQSITQEPEVGKLYHGTVVKLVDFGAFVKFLNTTEGLLHISEISNTRVKDVKSVLKMNQPITVKLLSIEKGKYRLSMKNIEQQTN